ncbi:MAG: ribonuclease J [Clostridia bacterium]
MNQNLRLNFLGGVEEIGKNCLAIECGQDIIVVDVGMTFPTDEMPGIDVVIPDTTFLRENKDRIRGIFLTHGHEDHIGGMPYLLEDVKVPVYGTKLTLTLLENKLKEKNIKAQLKTVKAGSVIKAGCFSVELIHVNHSIEGAVSLSITTPFGVIFHTGDFKIDYTPVDGVMTDLKRIAEIGKKGVLLLLAESTNIESPGYTMSEKTVGNTFDEIFGENIKKRIIIATFASNIHRVQQIIDTAIKYKRKVAFSGRSMLNIVDAARKIGALHVDDDIILDVEKLSNIQDKDLVIVSTGTQGEPMSALRRMAEGDFNKVKIGKNDTIVISATPIPGNEKMVYSVINKLYKLGADVIYSRLRDVHVSGHACQEELKLIHSLIKPKYFIPVHGEYRHLKKHKDLAIMLGMNPRDIMIPEIGDVIEVGKAIKRVGKVTAGAILVDGLGFGEMDSLLIKDRKHLSEDGVLILVAVVNALSGELMGDVEIIPRGIAMTSQPDKFLEETKQNVTSYLKQVDLKSVEGRLNAKNTIKRQVRNQVQRKIKQSPMIIPIIMES